MAVLFSAWYNQNEQRQYPIHEEASVLSDSGVALPDNCIVDANIWIPETAGTFVYLSSFVVTDHIVSATFMACDSDPLLPGAGNDVIVASIAVIKPATQYRNYDLSAHYPGVSGHITFGCGIDNNVDLRFSSSASAVFVRKTSRHYEDLPIQSISKEHGTELTGVVMLKSGNDIYIRAGSRVLNGAAEDVILIGLDTRDSYSVYQKYLSACDGRPESDSCGKAPLQYLNMVPPDCAGNITVEFFGNIYKSDTDNGQVIDVPYGMFDICPDKIVRSVSLDECAETPYIVIAFEMPDDPFAQYMHFNVQIATDYDFTDIVIDNESTGGPPFDNANSDWTYWDGVNWPQVPAAGVAPAIYSLGYDAKYTNTLPGLSPATRYWVRLRTYNGSVYSAWGNKFSYFLREGG
jgi:hypothetical protein